MKQCPQCKSTYSDDSLKFCLTDGTALQTLDVEKTQEMSARNRNALRIDLSSDQPETETFVSPAARPTLANSSNQTRQISKGVSPILVGLLVLLLLFVIVGFAGFLAYTFLGKQEVVSNKADTAVNSNQNSELSNLKDEIANLKEQINSQKQTEIPISTPIIREKIPDSTPTSEENTARINSPGDGFLALRSLPNHKVGERLAKIPHGTVISITGCQNRVVKIGKRTGRWCRVNYKGTSGWVFDAWLDR